MMRLVVLSLAALASASLFLAAPANAQAPARAGTPATASGKTAPKRAPRAVHPFGKRKNKPNPNAAIATFPAFKILEDGTSRVSVEVNRKVDVTETASPSRVVYRIKGAAAPVRNNRLPLLTDFFRTPVSRVELKSDGDDLDLVIDLREPSSVEHRIVETEDGVVLQVDFGRSAKAPEPAAKTPAPATPDAAKRTTKTKKIGDGDGGNEGGGDDSDVYPGM